MRYYFDNAATSFPKSPAVLKAIETYQRDCGAAAGRGGYRSAVEAGKIVDGCRTEAARLLQVPASRIVFTFNGTDGLNQAILGVCRPGDHVITTTWEHNSVLRPLRFLEDAGTVEVTRLVPDASGQVSPFLIQEALRSNTRLVIVQHASNVLGIVQDVNAIGQVVRAHGALFAVDAAQTAGHRPITLSDAPIDLWITSGHKGLGGPLGTGLLYVGPRAEDHMEPRRWGGTGTHSEDDRQPTELPDRFESGNLNVPGLAGLRAALSELSNEILQQRHQREHEQLASLWTPLAEQPGITLYGPSPLDCDRLGVISLNIDGFAPHELAGILDEHYGIEGRAGLHCAPGVHRWLGTIDTGGTYRLSLGPTVTDEDIAHVTQALLEIAGGHV
ncbi:MAG TPA: aminotransferase class V-fold PLP-dependent enzyme [Planctomycetaceae bacterium]|nr:aminotransferase class V-fold PLP-dependent enzyme [Planctomycetaceae bacterium]